MTVYQVFLAVDGEGLLPVGEKVLLETLSEDADGLFPNKASWRGFIYGNFGAGDRSYYLEGEPSANMLKKYCYPLDTYKHLFAQHIGGDKYVAIAPEHLEFSFSYDANIFNRNRKSDLPCRVDIFVKATLKE